MMGTFLLLLKAFTVSHDANAEAGMIPFDSPVGEIGGRGHWYSLRTMKGADYWKDQAVTSDIRVNEDGSYSVLGEAPISISIALHPDWYTDDQPWRRAIDWVRQAEQMYRNSGVQVRFVIEHIAVWDDFRDTVTSALTHLPFDEYVNQGNGADIVIGLKPPMGGDPYCGAAWMGGRSFIASCSPVTLAHEMGHVLGLQHAHRVGYEGRKGYCIEGTDDDCSTGTIMAYANKRIPLFAADGYKYKGNPMGSEENTAVEYLQDAVVEAALRYQPGVTPLGDFAADREMSVCN
jgi:hypothetical protein